MPKTLGLRFFEESHHRLVLGTSIFTFESQFVEQKLLDFFLGQRILLRRSLLLLEDTLSLALGNLWLFRLLLIRGMVEVCIPA